METLKELKTILLGQHITVYKDNKNIIYDNLTTEQVLRWRLLLEEYAPNIKYIKGSNNYEGDALITLPLINSDVT